MKDLTKAIAMLVMLLSISTISSAQLTERGTALPSDFRGSIEYSGTYSGYYVEPPSNRRRSGALSLPNLLGGNRVQRDGDFELRLQIDGSRVNGQISGSGGIVTSSFQGTRSGEICRLVNAQVVLEGRCTGLDFSALARESGQGPVVQRIEYVGRVVRVYNAAMEEREAELARAERARLAVAAQDEQRRLAAEERTRLASLPAASPNQATLVRRAVEQDAQSWLQNELDGGSIGDVRVLNRTGQNLSVRANYTYNGGTDGWVIAQFTNGRLVCLNYHDQGNACRPPRAAPVVRASDDGTDGGYRMVEGSRCFAYDTWSEQRESDILGSRQARVEGGEVVYGWEGLRTTVSGGDVRNRCRMVRRLQVTNGAGAVFVLDIEPYRSVRYVGTSQYRDLGPAN